MKRRALQKKQEGVWPFDSESPWLMRSADKSRPAAPGAPRAKAAARVGEAGSVRGATTTPPGTSWALQKRPRTLSCPMDPNTSPQSVPLGWRPERHRRAPALERTGNTSPPSRPPRPRMGQRLTPLLHSRFRDRQKGQRTSYGKAPAPPPQPPPPPPRRPPGRAHHVRQRRRGGRARPHPPRAHSPPPERGGGRREGGAGAGRRSGAGGVRLRLLPSAEAVGFFLPFLQSPCCGAQPPAHWAVPTQSAGGQRV